MNTIPITIGIVLTALSSPLLVQTSELESIQNAVVLDTRSTELFSAGHIPGAANLDVSSLSETRNEVAGLLKPVRELKQALASAGIDPAKRIIVYCGMENADALKDATRMFWILEYLGYGQVAVLDGGYAKWIAEGRAAETGASKIEAIELPELTVKPEKLATTRQVSKAVKDGDSAIVDLRGYDYFCGTKKADVAKSAGHIPTAANAPSEAFVSPDTMTVKSPVDVDALLSQAGIDENKPAITYCNTGRSASVGYFMLRMRGLEDVSLYDGSMAEWTSLPGRKVETEEPKAKE